MKEQRAQSTKQFYLALIAIAVIGGLLIWRTAGKANSRVVAVDVNPPQGHKRRRARGGRRRAGAERGEATARGPGGCSSVQAVATSKDGRDFVAGALPRNVS